MSVYTIYIYIYTIFTIYTYVNSPSTNHQECLPTSTASSLPSGRGLVPLEWCGGRGGAGPGEPSPGSPVGSGRHPEVRYPPSMAPPNKISGTTDMEGFFQTHIYTYIYDYICIYYCILYNRHTTYMRLTTILVSTQTSLSLSPVARYAHRFYICVVSWFATILPTK